MTIKRKYDCHTLFKLKLILLAFIIVTVLATIYPMVWLAPPLFALTPFLYIVLSLLWIPVVWLCRRVMWDKVMLLLIVVCCPIHLW